MTEKNIYGKIQVLYAGMAELADAYDSGSYERKFLRVQVPSSAPKRRIHFCDFVFFIYHLFTNSRKIQHLIQQVFNVSQNGSFFTDLLDFVEKNNHYNDYS